MNYWFKHKQADGAAISLLAKQYDVKLPDQFCQQVSNNHPFISLCHISSVEQERQFMEHLASMVNGPYMRQLRQADRQVIEQQLIHHVLPAIGRERQAFPFFTAMVNHFKSLNENLKETEPYYLAERKLARHPQFYSTLSQLLTLSIDSDVPRSHTIALRTIDHLLRNPDQTLVRMDALAQLVNNLKDRPRLLNLYGRYSRQQVTEKTFEALETLVCMPVDNGIWHTLVEKYLPKQYQPIHHVALDHATHGGLLSDGNLLLQHPEWSVLAVKSSFRRSGSDIPPPSRFPMPDVYPPQVVSKHFLSLYHSKGNPEQEEQHALKLVPFFRTLNPRLLADYVAHVDENAYERGRWPTESELMLIFKHPKIYDAAYEDVIDKLSEAITAPKNFVSHGIQTNPHSRLRLWGNIASLAHSFRRLKFDSRGGANCMLAQYGCKPTPGIPDFLGVFGNGYYFLKKLHRNSAIDPNTLIEFRRGFMVATHPEHGTLLVRNATITPTFQVRDILMDPAYYSKRSFGVNELGQLHPHNHGGFESVLAPRWYKEDPREASIGFLQRELQTALDEITRWKMDLVDPYHNGDYDFMKSKGFKAFTHRLEKEIEQKHRLWLELYSSDYPPTNPIPFPSRSGDEITGLPVDSDLIKEMTKLSQGIWAGRRGQPPTDFQEFILTGANHRAVVVVKDQILK